MRTVFVLMFGFVVHWPVCAQDNAAPWRAGLASIDITPSEPVRMSGYASRDQPAQGVNLELRANALTLEDAQGHRGIIVTTDLIGFRAAFAEPLCQRIVEATGLRREQILLNSTHTHTGPTLALDADDLDFPPEQAAATVRYSRQLMQTLVEVVQESIEDLSPARLAWGTGVATFVMNRREFTDRGVILGVNPRGLVDRSVPVLRIDAPDGTLRGVLFGAACHNTTLGSKNMEISGDFAGYAKSAIERAHPDSVAMFMQGCAGDANPWPRGSEEIARMHGATLGAEVLRVLGEELAPVAGPLATQFRSVDLPLQPRLSRAEIEQLGQGSGGWRGFVAAKMLEALEEEGQLPVAYSSPLGIWEFGDDLRLVALSGEVVVDYVAMLEQKLGRQRLWVAAYCNDVFGYIPSAQVLSEGGYETRGLYAGSVGIFSPDVERVLVDAVVEMAGKNASE